MRLSIVIPVFNEQDTVRTLIERVRALPLDKEILVVDDGSTDATGAILAEAAAAMPEVRFLRQTRNEGKGAAVRRGFDEARGDVVIVQDADLELDPADIARVAAPVLEGRARVCYGSRYLAARAPSESLGYWANRALTAFTNLLYGAAITDMETCYKCFERSALRRFRLESDRFDFEPEITAKLLRLGYGIQEVAVAYTPRSRAQGKKIAWRDGVQAIYTLVKYRILPLDRIEARTHD